MPQRTEELPFGAYVELVGHILNECSLFGKRQAHRLPLYVHHARLAELGMQRLSLVGVEYIGQMVRLGLLLPGDRWLLTMDMHMLIVVMSNMGPLKVTLP